MAKRLRVLVLASALAGCTAHGHEAPTAEQTEAQPEPEPDRFAWLAEVELPSLEHDPVLEFAAAEIHCSMVGPWKPDVPLQPSTAFLSSEPLLYGDIPGNFGFNRAVELPKDATVAFSIAPFIVPHQLSWSVGEELGGFERITWTPEGNPTRIDGFDRDGRWTRTAVFQHEAKLSRRVEFTVVDGHPVRGRTLVFEGEPARAIASLDGDGEVEYRRWRIDEGSQVVVFEHHPDRLVRTAQDWERGVPLERVDVLDPLP